MVIGTGRGLAIDVPFTSGSGPVIDARYPLDPLPTARGHLGQEPSGKVIVELA